MATMSWFDVVRYALIALVAFAAVGGVGALALAWLLNHPKD